MSPSAAAIDDESNSDVSSVTSVDVKELLDCWTSCYSAPKHENKDPLESSTTSEPSLEGSWRFDLGPLETKFDKSESLAEKCSRVHHMKDKVRLVDDDSDSDDFLSQMEEANLAMQKITRRTFEQSQSTAMETSKSSFDISFVSKDGTMEDSKNESANVEYSSSTVVPDKNAQADSELLQERRKARAMRMEKVRLRIAREKEEARAKKEDKERKVNEDNASEDARRRRAYEWYCRLGMISRKEMKKRIKVLGPDAQVNEVDCDLLPWNFNGSMVNSSKLLKLGIR